jgi:hypothetical protein
VLAGIALTGLKTRHYNGDRTGCRSDLAGGGGVEGADKTLEIVPPVPNFRQFPNFF